MVETIVGALIAGAAAAAQKTASDAVKGSYKRLKDLVRQKVSGDSMAEGTFDKLESDPDIWKVPAEQILAERNVGDDADLVRLARELLAQIPQGGDTYKTQISDATGFNIGPGGQVNIDRGEKRA